jgi:hypothetical protein
MSDQSYPPKGEANPTKLHKLLASKVMPENAFDIVETNTGKTVLIDKAVEQKVEERKPTREEWKKAWERLDKSVQSKGGLPSKEFDAAFDEELAALKADGKAMRLMLNQFEF